jgi:ubiquitin carboxyl-terminal hydrolase 25/28
LLQDFDDGIDMAELFRKTGDTISNLRESDSDNGPDSLASMLSPQLSDSVNFLSEAAQAELECKSYEHNLAASILTSLIAIDQELKDTRTMISTQFSDYQNLPYRLYAVFVHHGSVSFGHYYIYIYDFRKEIWRKYNDEYVTEVYNVNEIFENDSTNNPPTPYFLVYVNDAMKDRLADPVCRDVTESMPDMTEQETPAFMEDTRAASPTDVDMDPQFYDTAAPRGTPGTPTSLYGDYPSEWLSPNSN